MFPTCLSIKSSGYPNVNTRVEAVYFIDSLGCLYLHGLDRKRRRGDTFGRIHKARTAEQCLIDKRYNYCDYSDQQYADRTYDTRQLPFAEWQPQLREKLPVPVKSIGVQFILVLPRTEKIMKIRTYRVLDPGLTMHA